MLQEMHSGILSKPLWIDPACSPPEILWENWNVHQRNTRALAWQVEELSHTFCLHVFPYPPIFTTQDTRQRTLAPCPEPPASPNRLCLWVNGSYRAFTSLQAARGRRFLTSGKATNTQLEILWLSSSSLQHWVLIPITGKILSGPRICLNRAQTNGIHFGGTFSSHTKLYFFISLQSFHSLSLTIHLLSQTRP